MQVTTPSLKLAALLATTVEHLNAVKDRRLNTHKGLVDSSRGVVPADSACMRGRDILLTKTIQSETVLQQGWGILSLRSL